VGRAHSSNIEAGGKYTMWVGAHSSNIEAGGKYTDHCAIKVK